MTMALPHGVVQQAEVSEEEPPETEERQQKRKENLPAATTTTTTERQKEREARRVSNKQLFHNVLDTFYTFLLLGIHSH